MTLGRFSGIQAQISSLLESKLQCNFILLKGNFPDAMEQGMYTCAHTIHEGANWELGEIHGAILSVRMQNPSSLLSSWFVPFSCYFLATIHVGKSCCKWAGR